MTSTLPRPPSNNPPTGPLPALPVSKPRNSPQYGDLQTDDALRPSTSAGTGAVTPSKPHTRSVTLSGLPTPKTKQTQSTPTVPTLSTIPTPGAKTPTIPATSTPPTPGKTLRKTSSIGQFPAPPKVGPRISSLPPSPLSAAETADPSALPLEPKVRGVSVRTSIENGTRKPKSSRSSGYGVRPKASSASLNTYSRPSTNGTRERGAGSASRTSDSFLNLPSPPESRSSSAGASYEIPGIEDVDGEDMERGRPKSQETTLTGRNSISTKRSSGTKDSAKGNVLVSVRVRPDTSNGDQGSDGEWMVDGRRSLISYRGKESGDYQYGVYHGSHYGLC